jgi:hypothetical protein
MSIVPAIVRTDPDPTPNVRMASSARSRPRMRGQAEVVVRREVDDLAAVEGGIGFLFAFEHAKAPIQTLLFEGIELGGEVSERVVAHDQRLLTSDWWLVASS